MCAAFALPMLRYISEHISFAYIKTNQKTFSLFLLDLLESGAVRKLPRSYVSPSLTYLPPLPFPNFPNPSLEAGKGIHFLIANAHQSTVKPVLSRHPLLSGQQPKFPNLFPLFTLNEIFTKRTPKKCLKQSFLLLPTRVKRILVIKFHHPTCQTPEMRKITSNCHPQLFRFLH